MDRRLPIVVMMAAGLGLTALASGTLLDSEIITTASNAPVELSKWYGYRQYGEGPGDRAFANVTNAAYSFHVPLLTVWSSPECHFCSTLADLLNTPECRAYVTSKKIVFAYFKSGGADLPLWPADEASKQAYSHIVKHGQPASWPYFRFEWTRPDGSVVDTNGTFVLNFGKANEHVCTFDEFRRMLDGWLEGYDNKGSLDYVGGEFMVSGTADSRLEAEAGVTRQVWVPLVRSQSASFAVASQTLRWSCGGSEGAIPVNWAAGQADAFVSVEIPAEVTAGTEIVLRLENADGGLYAQSRIFVVDPSEPNQELPLWIGERTVDDLNWGEWTMDLDRATQKVAKAVANGAKAYTLALCGGELWCGDCKGTRKYLCETAEFKQWARDNHVMPVLIDIPSGATSPTMLSWDENASGVSGAYYLSRKGVGPDAAKEIFNRNHDLSYNVWCKPYEGRARVWVPTMVLLAGDGLPHGRLLGDRKYPNNPEYPSTDDYTLDTYMRRLDELLKLADDPTEWDNNDWSTTTLSLAADGGWLDSWLSALDGNSRNALNQKVIDVAELKGVKGNGELRVAIAGDRAANLRADVLVVDEGSGTVKTTVTTGPRFSLSSGLDWALTNQFDGVRAFIVLNGDDDAFFACNRDVDSTCSYGMGTAFTLICGESAETVSVSASECLHLQVREGSIYKLTGVAFTVRDSALVDLGDGLYRARTTGRVGLDMEAEGNFTYQRWNTGTIGFAERTLRVSERDGRATLTLCRVGGASGLAKVRLVYVGGTAPDERRDPENFRFHWDGDVILQWPDGIATNQTVDFPVFNRSPRWDGDQTVEFAILATEDSFAGLDSPTNCTVTIVEEDFPTVGRLVLEQSDDRFVRPGLALGRPGDEIGFSLVRTNGANTTVSAAVDFPADAGTILPTATATWISQSADAKRDFTLVLSPELTVGTTVVVRVFSEDIGMYGGIDRFAVQIVGNDAPGFAVACHEEGVVQFVECESRIGIEAEGYDRLEAVRQSGTLPDGVFAEVVGNALFFRGVPTHIGRFVSSWRVDGVCGGVLTKGGTVKVVLTVESVLEVCEAADDEQFPSPIAATCYSGFATNGTDGLVALLNLTARFDGRMSMSAELDNRRISLTSAAWFDADPGSVVARLADFGEGWTATLTWSQDGCGRRGFTGLLNSPVDAGLSGIPFALYSEDSCGAQVDAGVYTVDFAPVGGTGGHGFVSARVTKSPVGRACATYAGMYPDGRSFSGNAVLIGNEADYAYLPIVKRSASGTFSALLRVSAKASDSGVSFWSDYNHAVANASPVRWDRSDGSVPVVMSAGGGYYRNGMDLPGICLKSDLLTADLLYDVDIPWDGLQALYGLEQPDGCLLRTVHVAGSDVLLLPRSGDRSRLSFSLNRAAGVFNGKFRAVDAGGGERQISYRGVLLPNWGEACKSGCGGGTRPGPFKPFGVGTAYVSGHSGLPGVEIKFVPIQNDE